MATFPREKEMAEKTLQALLDEGGDIVLESGVYETGPVNVISGTHLTLKKGAVIKFIPDFSLYGPVYSRWEGVRCYCMHPCLFINDAEDVVIDGEGTIDGSGEEWWKVYSKKRASQKAPETEIEKKLASLNPGYEKQPGGGGGRQTQFLRPPLIQTYNAKNVRIEGITVQNSPFWTIHPVFTEGLKLINVTVHNPKDAPNTDGIDIDSCKDIEVIGCKVFVGDDGIALKSGSGPDGIDAALPTQNVIIKDCLVKWAHGGAVIGSETAAGINNVTVENCDFSGTDRGIRIKTRRGRGGAIHDLTFRNLKMEDNLCPLVINCYYKCGGKVGDPEFSLGKMTITRETPSVSNVEIVNCVATGSKASAGMLVGLPEMPIKNLTVKNCSFSLDKDANADVDTSDMYYGLPTPESRGLRIRNAENVTLDDVNVDCEGKKILIEENVK